ncbi:MAG TPA: coproporphyrinogen-III oxidase family protein [Pyrinomonadaceae bacterium]|nr:coproporphyrinogen-III oxidase family protein [Pyrinomonadaceae bacterium]
MSTVQPDRGNASTQADSGRSPSIEQADDRRLLMLYVNIPFCRSKCVFCDYVQPIPVADLLLTAQDATRQRYIRALCEEIRDAGKALKGKLPYVVYWGGGTASILEHNEIKAVMQALNESFDLSSVAEASIECSPDTIDPEKLDLFRSLGFDRFSTGVQSFDDERLRTLGRRHTAEEGRRAVQWARAAGFDNVNIDIMCGFPDETLDEVRHTVSEALNVKPDHLSLYSFRPTPGTTLRGSIDRDNKDLYLANQKISFNQGRKMITSAGYAEYASGYFGRPSLFAVMYFQMTAELIGFGSGAMSLFDGHFRTHTKGKLEEYIEQPTRYDVELPAAADPVVISSLRAGLSYFDGVLRDQWRDSTGTELDDVLTRPSVAPLIEYLRGRGLEEDRRGMRLPPDQVGNILIDMNFRLLGQMTAPPPVKIAKPKTQPIPDTVSHPLEIQS